MSRTYRVIQWGTGNVGRYALRAILGHPELELAGVVVHGASKIGRDAGELCGVDPVGSATAWLDSVRLRLTSATSRWISAIRNRTSGS